MIKRIVFTLVIILSISIMKVYSSNDENLSRGSIKVYVVPNYISFIKGLDRSRVKKLAPIKVKFKESPWDEGIKTFVNDFEAIIDTSVKHNKLGGDFRVLILVRVNMFNFFPKVKVWCDLYARKFYYKGSYYRINNQQLSDKIRELIPEVAL